MHSCSIALLVSWIVGVTVSICFLDDHATLLLVARSSIDGHGTVTSVTWSEYTAWSGLATVNAALKPLFSFLSMVEIIIII